MALRPALALVALLGGCASIDSDDWRFCVSREAYPELLDKMDANEPLFDGEGFDKDSDRSPLAFLLIPIVIAVPLAFDLAALPVTATHDVLSD